MASDTRIDHSHLPPATDEEVRLLLRTPVSICRRSCSGNSSPRGRPTRRWSAASRAAAPMTRNRRTVSGRPGSSRACYESAGIRQQTARDAERTTANRKGS